MKDTNGDAKSSDNDKNSFTNITFKAFEVLTVGVLIYGLFYLYKVYSSRPSSILSPKSGAIGLGKFVKSTRNNKKKTVHWSDELVDYVETEANMSPDSTNNNAIAAGVSLNYADNNVNTIDENLQDLSEGYSNINNNNKDSNMLGKVLTKLGYNGGSGSSSTSKKSYSKIQDEENAIELDDQFIVESDDEFGSRDHNNHDGHNNSNNNANSNTSN
ncbi:unnamed protein product [[Candida] boidinii]|uniref:Unnamed protein product n=1 Tax=Candida boidinii TaxID=5477 RepID=A0ACB5TSL8_CANBO|nr:unnamed protein product [[Candida] boidinii]